MNEIIAIIPTKKKKKKKKLLQYFLRYVFQLINQTKEKGVSKKYVRKIEILKDIMIKKK